MLFDLTHYNIYFPRDKSIRYDFNIITICKIIDHITENKSKILALEHDFSVIHDWDKETSICE